MIIWKYLAQNWKPALVRSGDWVPDQTTYYLNFPEFGIAYRFLAWFHNEHVDRSLRAIAERGKDRSFFFYAHTCGELAIPPDLADCPLPLPEEGPYLRPLTPLNLTAGRSGEEREA